MSSVPAGWQPDPTGRHQYRYWDASAWTEHVADEGVSSTDPPTMDAQPAPSAPAPPPATPTAFGAPVAPSGYVSSPRKRASPVLSFAAIGGGVALVIGSFLESANASLNTEVIDVDLSRSYLDGDGPLTLVCGLVIIVIALLVGLGVMPHWGAFIVAGFGALGALIAVIDIIDVQQSIDDVESSASLGASMSIGPALWVCLAGGVAVLVLGLFAFVNAKAESPTS